MTVWIVWKSCWIGKVLWCYYSTCLQ